MPGVLLVEWPIRVPWTAYIPRIVDVCGRERNSHMWSEQRLSDAQYALVGQIWRERLVEGKQPFSRPDAFYTGESPMRLNRCLDTVAYGANFIFGDNPINDVPSIYPQVQ